MALILTSQSTIQEPFGPTIWDTDERLMLRLNANMAEVADGAPVSSLIATGGAPIGHRTFTVPTGWTAPVLDSAATPDGKPALIFDRNHQLATLGSYLTYGQPLTYLIAGAIDFYTDDPQSRIIAGAGNPYNVLRPASGAGNIRAYSGDVSGSSAGSTVGLGLVSGEWGVFGAVFDGNNSFLVTPAGAVITLSGIGSHGCAGLRVGGASGTSPSSFGFKGSIAEIRQYAGALTIGEIANAQAAAREVCGI